MEESELELNTFSLEEQEKVATSLEDVYGYKVLTEAFQEQIDNYNMLKQQERQLCLQYVFTGESKDTVMEAFQAVMHAETSIVIGNEYEMGQEKNDSIFMMAGFAVLGAMVTALIWSFVESKQKGKKRRENYSNNGNSFNKSKD